MKVFNYNRNYNRRTNTHNFLRHDYQIRNASSFKKHERRGENVELKDLTCVTVIFTLRVIIDWNVPSRKLLVPFEIHDFSFYQKSLIEQRPPKQITLSIVQVTESERNTKVKRRGTINSSITSNCPRVSQSLTIARSFSYEADCVIASRMLATGSRGNKRRTAQRKLLKEEFQLYFAPLLQKDIIEERLSLKHSFSVHLSPSEGDNRTNYETNVKI
ncbi:uncharacterized protein LOC117232833 [Bombus vosnesenskii]|uniref:Uncharacterized protein LOC117232833 n=1 Tax=Bombus vosnesenskii TaxID=207650 RepID=A0A6J3K7D7_9HYME|nr:uncharacterized protein LOC117232833 [Bombus vosnesenskii]